MRDEYHAHAKPLLQPLHEVQDFSLDGDIKRRRRFIGNQQFRIVRKRHGDHHALPLPA